MKKMIRLTAFRNPVLFRTLRASAWIFLFSGVTGFAAETLQSQPDSPSQPAQAATVILVPQNARTLQLPYPYSSPSSPQLAQTLLEAATRAGSLARTMGVNIGNYMREMQIRKTQEDLVGRFYETLFRILKDYPVSEQEARRIAVEVEKMYIEDGENQTYGFDSVGFREMPDLVRKIYADILLEKTRDGRVTTYHLNGNVRTRWNLKNGRPHGPITSHYENGEILYIDIYEDGRKIRRQKFDPEGRLEFEQNYDYDAEDHAGLPAESPAVPEADPPPAPAPAVSPADAAPFGTTLDENLQ